MFGLVEKWKRRRPHRLTRLASAIEALNERDKRVAEETDAVARLRIKGATELYSICMEFVNALNSKLLLPSIFLDPSEYYARNFTDSGPNIFQINLRGRLLQIEFTATEELYSTDDFRRPYVLQGAVRSFNRELLQQSVVDEQSIYYCAENGSARWFYFDCRTYRTGRVTSDFLATELERLL